MSVKLLLVGILALVAIGLFRRYNEDGSGGANSKPDVVDDDARAVEKSGVPAQLAPNASAPLLAEPANSAN